MQQQPQLAATQVPFGAPVMPQDPQQQLQKQAPVKKTAAADTPADKFKRIFTSEMPAHEKIIQFTK